MSLGPAAASLTSRTANGPPPRLSHRVGDWVVSTAALANNSRPNPVTLYQRPHVYIIVPSWNLTSKRFIQLAHFSEISAPNDRNANYAEACGTPDEDKLP